MIKIFFSGPIPPPITGQAFAFSFFFENCKFDKKVIDTNSKDGKIRSIIFYLLVLYKTMFYALFGTYDVLYFTCSRTVRGSLRDIILINAASIRKKPIINHLHGADFQKFYKSKSGFYQKILQNAYSKVGTSVVLLDKMKSEFIDFEKTMKVVEIPNFYDPILEDYLPDSANNLNKKLRLLYFSNLMYTKGILEVLQAYKELKKAVLNVELYIAGRYMGDNGMSVNDIKKAVEPYFDLPDIHYVGTVSGRDKANFLEKGDIFILPTFYKSEAFPISILEAMRCGCAILTTRHNYLPEIIDNKNGALIEPKNTNELIKVLKGWNKNRTELYEIQKYNVSYASDKFAPKRYIERLNLLIEKSNAQV